ncbi:MAG: phosphoglycerate dehydrogenase [Gemmatimonadetes bacterium]|nr:phosphoglycerate dehydrogenase [Gemmatimonadota bacterium]
MFRILLADKIAPEGVEPLRSDGRFELVERYGLQGEELARALADVDAVIVRSATRITRETLMHGQRLRVIGRAGVGVDNIDVDAATERGVAVLNAPSGNTTSAAELTLALLLALVRRIPAADRSMKGGDWNRASFRGVELYGKTLGLVGAGRIGGEVARRARAFGMRVVAYDPYLSPERAETLEIELATLEEVLRRADILSLHVPLTESTAGMIGEAELAMMKPGALLVNAARGGVVDEQALCRFLADRRLAGAALDVFDREPLPADHPLRKLDNLVLTPHLGAATEEAQQNVAIEIAQAVRAALLEGDFSRAVNAPAIGGEEMRRLRPLLDLAERLGLLAAALADGAMEQVEVRYAGAAEEELLRPMAAGVLIGILSSVVGRSAVNLVNALHLAEARGIQVRRVRLGPHGDYGEYLEVLLAGAGIETRVAGALLGEGHARVVRIGDFHVDVVPRGSLVVLRNRDVPGVIGRVGTLLGNSGINIGEYHQARLQAGGQALAAISVDGRLPGELVDALRRLPEVLEVRQVQLD